MNHRYDPSAGHRNHPNSGESEDLVRRDLTENCRRRRLAEMDETRMRILTIREG